ncbi:hypothetical protein [Sphingomicrobium astaxanthinifaciens]|uniref:hypothetical protein n=1 Tax=Sphingomicrobium astaxanthinifaciens TaxID=1227949 RepID=UPI001FCBAF3D|nr:hypothetical protein [Sphingomicrobium astaxanthinifaciens]MCJ7421949.1 hypothetical protein [Sphingomicrobium astaxanthinifaciens]
MMRSCPKCQSSQIDAGYVVDHGYGEKKVASFHAGAPDKRWWGLKTSKAATTPVTVYRCTRCGYLESYVKG